MLYIPSMLSESAWMMLLRSSCKAKNMIQAHRQMRQSSYQNMSTYSCLCRWCKDTGTYPSHKGFLFLLSPCRMHIESVSPLIFLNRLVEFLCSGIREHTSVNGVLISMFVLVWRRPGGFDTRRHVDRDKTPIFATESPPRVGTKSWSFVCRAIRSRIYRVSECDIFLRDRVGHLAFSAGR